MRPRCFQPQTMKKRSRLIDCIRAKLKLSCLRFSLQKCHGGSRKQNLISPVLKESWSHGSHVMAPTYSFKWALIYFMKYTHSSFLFHTHARTHTHACACIHTVKNAFDSVPFQIPVSHGWLYWFLIPVGAATAPARLHINTFTLFISESFDIWIYSHQSVSILLLQSSG